MPYPKRHRAGREMPKIVHLDPDPRAFALAEELVQEPAIQCVILNGSRYRGRWDDQSDLDTLIILEKGQEEKGGTDLRTALQQLREEHYPGYEDVATPDHGVGHGEIIVTMEYFLNRRRTLNDAMAQSALQGKIYTKRPEDVAIYQHDGDTSREWEFITYPKLERAACKLVELPMNKHSYHRRAWRSNIHSPMEGRNAYWLLWESGSAILSILGLTYMNRSLVAMANSLKENMPQWNYQFASDLDCLDQYNSCACEEVVTCPIQNMEAMWKALEKDRKALWDRIERLSDVSIWDKFKVAQQLENFYGLLAEADYRAQARAAVREGLLEQAGVTNPEVIERIFAYGREKDEFTRQRELARVAGSLKSEDDSELDRCTVITRTRKGESTSYLIFQTAITAEAEQVKRGAHLAQVVNNITGVDCRPGVITDAPSKELAECLQSPLVGMEVVRAEKLNNLNSTEKLHQEQELAEDVLMIHLAKGKERAPWLL